MINEIGNHLYPNQNLAKYIRYHSTDESSDEFKSPMCQEESCTHDIGLTITKWENRVGCKTISRLRDYVAKHPETRTTHKNVTVSTLELFGTSEPCSVSDGMLEDCDDTSGLYDCENWLDGEEKIYLETTIIPSMIVTSWDTGGEFLGAFLPTNSPGTYTITSMLVNAALDHLEKMEELELK